MTLEEVREFFINDRFATLNGMVIDEIGEKYAVCSVSIQDSHKNGMGGVMGGVMFTLADFAFAVAANKDKPPFVVSLDANIAYLSPCKGDTLRAVATCVKDGKSTCYYDIVVEDDFSVVAKVSVTGYKLPF